jgi:hypothetical protein
MTYLYRDSCFDYLKKKTCAENEVKYFDRILCAVKSNVLIILLLPRIILTYNKRKASCYIFLFFIFH